MKLGKLLAPGSDKIGGVLGKVFGGVGKWFGKPKLDYSIPYEYMRAGIPNKDAMKAFGGPTSFAAYGNLLQMLHGQGRTDPRMMNRTLSGIQRNTQGNVDAVTGNLQAHGFQNSGVGQALIAALQQGGSGQQAGVMAQDAADAEQRKMAALQLFQQLVGNPSLDYSAMGIGQYNSNKQREMQIQGAKLGVLQGLGKGILGGLGG